MNSLKQLVWSSVVNAVSEAVDNLVWNSVKSSADESVAISFWCSVATNFVSDSLSDAMEKSVRDVIKK